MGSLPKPHIWHLSVDRVPCLLSPGRGSRPRRETERRDRAPERTEQSTELGKTTMDYCAPCRRHLNGALSCPGCGAPASAEAPFAGSTPGPADHPGPVTDPLPGPAEARRNRRSRRRSRRRGRLLAVTAVTLALGGAGVLALTPPQSGGPTGPAPTPAAEDHGPEVALQTAPPAPSPITPSTSPSAGATRSRAHSRPSGPPSSSAPVPTVSAATASSTTAPRPSTTLRPTKPAPSPSPTCTHFLFWCS
ncbi:SCO2400 family protein [Kitasatospora sp. NPDC001175]